MTRPNEPVRIHLVGHLDRLHFTDTEVRFHLNGPQASRHFCRSSRPDVIATAGDLHDGQLVGVIGASCDGGFTIDRLELLGRAEREVVG